MEQRETVREKMLALKMEEGPTSQGIHGTQLNMLEKTRKQMVL